MKREVVSILIPVYNQEKYVIEALDSVCQQTYRPLEVVIVDDGSTDASFSLLTKWVATHTQPDFTVTLLHQENAGVIAACNAAYAAAHGDYLLRLDGDDFVPPDYIAVLHHALQPADSSVAYAYCDAHYTGARHGLMASAPYSLRRLVTENYIHVSALVRAKVIKECGYFSATMEAGFEDWDFWLLLAEHGYCGMYVTETFLWYRQYPEGNRNRMSSETHRQLRQQIQRNHPGLYRKTGVQLAVRLWQIRRRIQRYFPRNIS